ncbi:hypothetical protein A2U01_0047584, partial [Trifolium medium]|nr:hypothetical protein [Trifolium medium]
MFDNEAMSSWVLSNDKGKASGIEGPRGMVPNGSNLLTI